MIVARPLHVLVLSPTRGTMGGADRDWVNLANAFDPQKVRITWAGVYGSAALRPHLKMATVPRIIDAGFPLFHYLIHENANKPRSRWLWAKILADHALRGARSLVTLRLLVARDPVDTVVSNSAAVTVGMPLARLCGARHIWSVKECLDPARAACRIAGRLIAAWSDLVTVPSRACDEVFMGRALVLPDASDIALITCSASTKSREDVLAQLDLPADRPVVAQVGGLVHWKGQHITAAACVNLARTGRVFSMLFLGSGTPDQTALLEAILNAVPGLCNRVRFVAFSPEDFSLLNASDFVVHPSVLPDPLPNAVREALILGKPVIGSNSGGIPDLIREGQTGFLVVPDSAEKLASAMETLLANPELVRTMGAEAALDACGRFDVRERQHEMFKLLT